MAFRSNYRDTENDKDFQLALARSLTDEDEKRAPDVHPRLFPHTQGAIRYAGDRVADFGFDRPFGGVNCYMNAALQCLVSTSVLFDNDTSRLVQGVDVNTPAPAIHPQMPSQQKMQIENEQRSRILWFIRALWGARTDVTPVEDKTVIMYRFVSWCGLLNSQWLCRGQEDSGEFILFLLNQLDEKFARQGATAYTYNDRLTSHVNRDRAMAEDLHNRHFRTFRFLECSRHTCRRCASDKWSMQYDQMLSVPIMRGGYTLEQLLGKYFMPETSTAIDRNCSVCRVKSGFSKTLSLGELPPVLIIRLKRFNNDLRKIEDEVEFTTQMNMARYSVDTLTDAWYDLYAVIYHNGTAGVGHYTCRVVMRDRSVALFDDAKHPIVSSTFPFKDAYILFFRRRA
jgi:ubiquitin C-terminal hydrolase